MKSAFAVLAALSISLVIPPAAQNQGSASADQSSAAHAALRPQANPLSASAGGAGNGSAQSSGSRAGASEEEESQKPSRGDGIKIHGHWVIEVKNPDGTVTVHREFENSIQAPGMTFLASLLAGTNSSGGLSILLNGASTFYCAPTTTGVCPTDGYTALFFNETGPCAFLDGGVSVPTPLYLLSDSAGGTCLITTALNSSGKGSAVAQLCANAIAYAATTNLPPPCSTNLTMAAPTITVAKDASGLSAQVVLAGSIVTTQAGTGAVNDVETIFTSCDTNTTPVGCLNLSLTAPGPGTPTVTAINLLTERNLDGVGTDPPVVPYMPGQSINVVVTITFM